MKRFVAENITVYKIKAKSINEEYLENYDSLITGFPTSPFYIILKNGQESSFLESIAEDKFKIDKLYHQDKRRETKVDRTLARDATYKVDFAAKEGIKKEMENKFKNVSKDVIGRKDLEEYVKEGLKNSGKKDFILKKYDLLLISSIANDGWTFKTHELQRLNFLEKKGLIEKKYLRSWDAFVRLTDQGMRVKEDVMSQIKKSLESRELPQGVFASVLKEYPPDELEFRKEYARITR